MTEALLFGEMALTVDRKGFVKRCWRDSEGEAKWPAARQKVATAIRTNIARREVRTRRKASVPRISYVNARG